MKLVTIVEGNSKVPFSIATIPKSRGGNYSFTSDTYLIKVIVKLGGTKYHFFSLCYDSTWD